MLETIKRTNMLMRELPPEGEEDETNKGADTAFSYSDKQVFQKPGSAVFPPLPDSCFTTQDDCAGLLFLLPCLKSFFLLMLESYAILGKLFILSEPVSSTIKI